MVVDGASPGTCCDSVNLQNDKLMFLHHVTEKDVITIIENIKKH